MSNPKPVERFTPGPWSITDRGDLIRIREELSDAVIATTDDGGHPDETIFDHEAQLANARLISAAPDLLDALVAAKQEMWLAARHQWTMADFKGWAIIQQIDAALNKARGTARVAEAA